VPWTYFQKNDLVGKKVFNIVFPYSCDESEHRIMDVRNGILMWGVLNAPFDKFYFTILKKTKKENAKTIVYYVVETLAAHEFPDSKSRAAKELQLVIIALNGKEIFFDIAKQNEWPGEKFLKFHNECFYQKKEDMKLEAQAEAQELKEDDSSQTLIAERLESSQKVKSWFSVTDGTEIPLFEYYSK
jgi:hypothetical protein